MIKKKALGSNHKYSNYFNNSLTNDLNFLAVIIAITTIIKNLGFSFLPSNITNGIEALAFLFVYFIYILNKGINLFYLSCILISILILLINKAPEMISITMTIVFIAIINAEKDIDYNKILKTFTFISLILFILIILAYYTFNFNNNDAITARNGIHVARKSIGFFFPNEAMMQYLSIIYGLLGILNSSNHRIFYLFLALITWLIYTQTKSRTSYIIILFVLILLFLLGNIADKILPNFLGKIVTLMPILFLILSLYVLFAPYNKNLDSLLANRLKLYVQYYHEGGIHLLANEQLNRHSIIDNYYLEALIAKGIVFTIEMITVFTAWLNHYSRKITWKAAILIFSFFALGFTEVALQHFDMFFVLALILAKSPTKDTANLINKKK